MTGQAESERETLLIRLRTFAREWRNASYSILDHLWILGLWAVSTPIFLTQLGATAFGIWTMINALIGLTGVMSFGFSEATVRYVSKYHDEQTGKTIVKVLEASLTLFAATGLFFAGLISWSAPWLVERFFDLGAALREQTVHALYFAAYVLFITAYLKTLEAVINGFHRYDVTARISMLTRSFIILGNVGLALAGHGIDVMLMMVAIGLSGQTVTYYLLVRRGYVRRFRLLAIPERRVTTELVGYGLQAWLQISAGAMASIVDRFLVGAMISPAAAGVYAICVQLAQQIHLLVLRGGAYLVPATSAVSSAKTSGDDTATEIEALYRGGLHLALFVVGVTALPLIVLSPQILTFWVGAEIAGQGSTLLAFLAVYFTLYAGLVPPYYMLNGVGHPKWNTAATLTHGITLLGLTLALLPGIGLMAPVVARLVAFPALCLIFAGFHRYVLPRGGFGINATFWARLIAFPLIGWGIGVWAATWPQQMPLPALVSAILALSGLGAVMAGWPVLLRKLRGS